MLLTADECRRAFEKENSFKFRYSFSADSPDTPEPASRTSPVYTSTRDGVAYYVSAVPAADGLTTGTLKALAKSYKDCLTVRGWAAGKNGFCEGLVQWDEASGKSYRGECLTGYNSEADKCVKYFDANQGKADAAYPFEYTFTGKIGKKDGSVPETATPDAPKPTATETKETESPEETEAPEETKEPEEPEETETPEEPESTDTPSATATKPPASSPTSGAKTPGEIGPYTLKSYEECLAIRDKAYKGDGTGLCDKLPPWEEKSGRSIRAECIDGFNAVADKCVKSIDAGKPYQFYFKFDYDWSSIPARRNSVPVYTPKYDAKSHTGELGPYECKSYSDCLFYREKAYKGDGTGFCDGLPAWDAKSGRSVRAECIDGLNAVADKCVKAIDAGTVFKFYYKFGFEGVAPAPAATATEEPPSATSEGPKYSPTFDAKSHTGAFGPYECKSYSDCLYYRGKAYKGDGTGFCDGLPAWESSSGRSVRAECIDGLNAVADKCVKAIDAGATYKFYYKFEYNGASKSYTAPPTVYSKIGKGVTATATATADATYAATTKSYAATATSSASSWYLSDDTAEKVAAKLYEVLKRAGESCPIATFPVLAKAAKKYVDRLVGYYAIKDARCFYKDLSQPPPACACDEVRTFYLAIKATGCDKVAAVVKKGIEGYCPLGSLTATATEVPRSYTIPPSTKTGTPNVVYETRTYHITRTYIVSQTITKTQVVTRTMIQPNTFHWPQYTKTWGGRSTYTATPTGTPTATPTPTSAATAVPTNSYIYIEGCPNKPVSAAAVTAITKELKDALVRAGCTYKKGGTIPTCACWAVKKLAQGVAPLCKAYSETVLEAYKRDCTGDDNYVTQSLARTTKSYATARSTFKLGPVATASPSLGSCDPAGIRSVLEKTANDLIATKTSCPWTTDAQGKIASMSECACTKLGKVYVDLAAACPIAANKLKDLYSPYCNGFVPKQREQDVVDSIGSIAAAVEKLGKDNGVTVDKALGKDAQFRSAAGKPSREGVSEVTQFNPQYDAATKRGWVKATAKSYKDCAFLRGYAYLAGDGGFCDGLPGFLPGSMRMPRAECIDGYNKAADQCVGSIDAGKEHWFYYEYSVTNGAIFTEGAASATSAPAPTSAPPSPAPATPSPVKTEAQPPATTSEASKVSVTYAPRYVNGTIGVLYVSAKSTADCDYLAQYGNNNKGGFCEGLKNESPVGKLCIESYTKVVDKCRAAFPTSTTFSFFIAFNGKTGAVTFTPPASAQPSSRVANDPAVKVLERPARNGPEGDGQFKAVARSYNDCTRFERVGTGAERGAKSTEEDKGAAEGAFCDGLAPESRRDCVLAFRRQADACLRAFDDRKDEYGFEIEVRKGQVQGAVLPGEGGVGTQRVGGAAADEKDLFAGFNKQRAAERATDPELVKAAKAMADKLFEGFTQGSEERAKVVERVLKEKLDQLAV
ncbi:hypothetical protein HDU96_000902 [Phlyctochytrium bullatum]|nr:hypothetical protein HDU96_000902 [Phlyctochytrium bullatum]